MIKQVSGYVAFVSLLLFAVSCSRQPELAGSAIAKDFDGHWSGRWSWATNNTTSVDISGTNIQVSRFPIDTAPAGGIVIVSGGGQVRFQSHYGSQDSPCILLFFENPRDVVPLCIAKDKKHLIYDVNIIHDQQIILERIELGQSPRTNSRKTD